MHWDLFAVWQHRLPNLTGIGGGKLYLAGTHRWEVLSVLLGDDELKLVSLSVLYKMSVLYSVYRFHIYYIIMSQVLATS